MKRIRTMCRGKKYRSTIDLYKASGSLCDIRGMDEAMLMVPLRLALDVFGGWSDFTAAQGHESGIMMV
jgi:hypothetical protein